MDREFLPSDSQRAELGFRIRGVDFRVGVAIEWSHLHRDFGLCFTNMNARRRGELNELLGELNPEAQLIEKEGDDRDLTPEDQSDPRKPQEAETPDSFASPGKSLLAIPASETRKPAVAAPAKATSAQKQGRERRVQSRHSVDARATIFLIDVRCNIQGRILDVSLSGCRIRSEERFPVGIYRRVEVEFTLDGLPFRLSGVVQSLHDRSTIGIRYLDLSDRKREQLTALVQELEELRSATHSAQAQQSPATCSPG